MTDIWQHHRSVAIFTFPYPTPPLQVQVLSLVNATGCINQTENLTSVEKSESEWVGARATVVLPYVSHQMLNFLLI